MAYKQTLFSATFEEAKRFVPNMFTLKPYGDNFNLLESNSFFKRLIAFMGILSFFGSQFIIYGILFPKNVITVKPNEVYFVNVSILQGAYIFRYLKWVIIINLIIIILLLFINLFPTKHYANRRKWTGLVVFFVIVTLIISIIPFFLGTSLGALGWFGFAIGNVYGVTFFIKMMKKRINHIKNQLYHKQNKIGVHQLDALDNQGIDKLWAILKTYRLVVLSIIIVNILIFRIGMWGERTIWSIWGVSIIIYWLVVTFFSYGMLPLFMRTFYFVKYAEQYRQLWKATDEQWYGPRKAKRLAKKRINDK